MRTTFTLSTLKSTFKGYEIKVYSKESPTKSKTTLILHPGAFESVWGDDERYKKIIFWLQNNLEDKPNIVTYQTSRIDIPMNKNETKLVYWKRIFRGKKFNHELEDIRKVYKYILSPSFWEKTHLRTQKIYTLGFSLGGTLSLILTQEFSQVVKAIIVGSAISTKRPTLPVLLGYPSKERIKKILRTYTGTLSIFQGTEEEVVAKEDVVEIFSSCSKAQYVSLHRLRGADHMFSGANKFGLFKGEQFLEKLKYILDR